MPKSACNSRFSPWLCWGLAALCVAGIGFLRLSPLTTRIIPIAFSIPLILCVWFDDKRLLWIMATCFAVIGLIRTFVVDPAPNIGAMRFVMAGIQIFDVAAIAAAVHLLIDARRRVDAATESIDLANRDLASRQETLAQQNKQLSNLNQQFARREMELQTLLAATRWDASHAPGNQVISNICSAAIRLLGGDVAASAIIQREGDSLRIIGEAGFEGDTLNQTAWPLKDSHAAAVMDEGKTSVIEDLAGEGQSMTPGVSQQPALRSMIATPLRLGGRVAGVIEAYSRSARAWGADDFKIIEWLAAQASLAMEIVFLQRELEQRRRDAVGESVRKTRFLVAISHDVRTPANAMNLLAELMVRSAENPQLASEIPELAREMRQSALALTELISDMLDVARFDSAGLQLEISEFLLDELCERQIAQLKHLGEAKGLELRFDNSQDAAGIVLRTDRTKLARVLTNLVANAIKFTEAGSITVGRKTSIDGGVKITVADTGIGIPESVIGQIFDEFFQLTNPARDRSKGTGLGLAICKRLVAAMGCELDVQSSAGAGTTFTITVPAGLVLSGGQNPSAGSRKDLSARLPSKPLAGMPILLVEDHVPTRRATARLLKEFGATVLQAETGNDAMKMLREESPQVLLLDLMLPDIDGSEVLKFLLQSPNRSLRLIFAVSGDVTPERAEQVKSLGANDLIPKPVNIEHLVRRISAELT
jgi:signal transduction histidine kinase/CheY-like chemotaxis protein